MRQKFTVDTFREFLKKNNFGETLVQSSPFYEIIEQITFTVITYVNIDACVSSVLDANPKSIVILCSIPDNIDLGLTRVYNNNSEITKFYFDELNNFFYINLDRHLPIGLKIITQSRLNFGVNRLIFNYNLNNNV